MTAQGIITQTFVSQKISIMDNNKADGVKGVEKGSFQNTLKKIATKGSVSDGNGYHVKNAKDDAGYARRNAQADTERNMGSKVVLFSGGEVSKTVSAMSTQKPQLEDMASAEKGIISMVAKLLQMTEEELVDRMKALGMTFVDLLNPQMIMKLMLVQDDAQDVTFFLTNEDATAKLSDITGKLNDFLSDIGMTREQLEAMYDELGYADQAAVGEEIDSFDKVLAGQAQGNGRAGNDDAVGNAGSEGAKDETVVLGRQAAANDGQDRVSKAKDEGKDLTVDTDDKAVTTNGDIVVKTIKLDDEGQLAKPGDQKGKSQDSTNEANVDIGQQFLDRIADAFSVNRDGEYADNVRMAAQIRDIANQIIEQIKITIRPLQTSMEMDLHPEHLGKVSLNLISREGLVTAQFATENRVAKEAIESNIQILRENLENQGVKVEAIEVTIMEYSLNKDGTGTGDERQGRQGSNRRRTVSMDDLGLDDATLGEIVEEALLGQVEAGGNFDYSA